MLKCCSLTFIKCIYKLMAHVVATSTGIFGSFCLLCLLCVNVVVKRKYWNMLKFVDLIFECFGFFLLLKKTAKSCHAVIKQICVLNHFRDCVKKKKNQPIRALFIHLQPFYLSFFFLKKNNKTKQWFAFFFHFLALNLTWLVH